MRPGIRFGLSAIEKREVWSRWKAGESLHEIGRAFDKPHSCIRAVLLPRGGIPPAARRRSRWALTFAKREDISRGIASGCSIRELARGLDRAGCSVCRAAARHGGRPAYPAPEADRRCDFDPPKACGSGRPSPSWSLGRRSAGRWKEQLHCDSGGTSFALCHADQGAEQRNRSGGCGFNSACSQTPFFAKTFADLGSRTGDGQAQGVYGSHEGASLLLRSTKSLATRHQRKHQSAFEAILPARHGPFRLFASAARPGLAALKSTTQKNIGIRNSRE